MTGEMYREDITREAYPLHFAIADALKGTVELFDVYQEPYVLIGADHRCGRLDVCRLWITKGPRSLPDSYVSIYNEKTGTYSKAFQPHKINAEKIAIHEAKCLLRENDMITDEVKAELNRRRTEGMIFFDDAYSVMPERITRRWVKGGATVSEIADFCIVWAKVLDIYKNGDVDYSKV